MTSWTQCALTTLIKDFLKRCHDQEFTGPAVLDALDDDIQHYEKIQTIKTSASKDEWMHAWKKTGPNIIMATVGKLAYVAKAIWKDHPMCVKRVHVSVNDEFTQVLESWALSATILY
eukprot:3643271-Karenia_brevis.AAC.1